MFDTITVLLYLAIFILEAYIICNEVRLWILLKHRSDARTNARRAAYRKKAYKDLEERTAIKKKRQELWRSIRK